MAETTQGGGKRLYVIVIILLLFVNIGAFVLLYNENKAKKDLGDAKAALDQNYKALNDTLDSKKGELEQFRGKNAELDSIVNEKEADIEKQKKQIGALYSKGKMTSDELAKAKQMITVDESAIADLQKKVDDLTKANQQLTSQNQQLNTDLSSEKQNTAQLTQQNQGLSKKVEIGSLLHLQKIVMQGVEVKKNGKEVEEKKIKKMQKLKISFETGDNKVLEPGTVSLYMRIITPKGEAVYAQDAGSGTLKDVVSGQDVQYTKRADITWNQQNSPVSMYWTEKLTEPGIYKLQVYQSGYVVGEGQVELK